MSRLLEYGVLASLIAVVCYPAVGSRGGAAPRVLDSRDMQSSAPPPTSDG